MDPLSLLISQESRSLTISTVRSAVSALPEIERLVTRLAYFEEMDERDIGHCTAMPVAKVRRALARARSMLKARLQ